MREYCYLNRSWIEKIKGEKYAPILRAIFESNLKRQMMTKEEGMLFIRLKKRELDRKTHERRIKP